MTVKEEALKLIDMGFSVIPIAAGSKEPPRGFNVKQYRERRATPEEVEEWFRKWPKANLALLCGNIPASEIKVVAVDADSPEAIEWMNRNLQKTSVYNLTSKGRHGLYVLLNGYDIGNKNFRKSRLKIDIDIRGTGGYIIIPPSIHESGHQYKWEFTPGFNGWDDLAPFDFKVFEKGMGMGNISRYVDLSQYDYFKSDDKPWESGEPIQEGTRDDTLTRLAGFYMGAHGLNLPQEKAFVLLEHDNKTRCKPPLPSRDITRIIKSVGESEASQYSPEIEIVEEVPDFDAVPHEEFNPGGLIGAIIKEIEECTAASHPYYSLGAAIVLVGSLAGQKVMTATELRTNLYAVSVGYSSAGKNAALKMFPKLVDPMAEAFKDENGKNGIPAEFMFGMDAFTSHAAILRHLSTPGYEVSLATADEIDDFFARAKNIKDALTALPKDLSRLWSMADRGYSKPYSDRKNNIEIRWHHLSIYGTATPREFWSSLSSTHALNGFMARLLVFESLHGAPLPKGTVATPDIGLVEQLSAIWEMPPFDYRYGTGNLKKMTRVPIPHRITNTKGAKEILDKFCAKYNELQRQNKDDRGASTIYGKAYEQACRLALIKVLSNYGAATPGHNVEEADAYWATRLMDRLVRDTVHRIQSRVAFSDAEAIHLLIVRIIQDCIQEEAKKVKLGKKKRENAMFGATVKQILNHPEWCYDMKEFEVATKTMMKAGRIAKRKYSGPGRYHPEYFVLVKDHLGIGLEDL